MILLIILLAVCLLLLTRAGAYAKFGPDGFSLRILLGIFSLTILPLREKKPKREKPERKPKKEKTKKAKKQPGASSGEQDATPRKRPLFDIGRFDKKKLIRAAFKAMGRGFRMTRVDILELRVTVASGEPHKTALLYGSVCAALGAAIPFINRRLRVRRQNVTADLSFERVKMSARGRVKVTVSIAELVWFGLWAAVTLLKCQKSKTPKG